MDILEIEPILDNPTTEDTKTLLETRLKPFQQAQAKRQKMADFVKKCLSCMDKNDFFQLDELLKSKQRLDVLEDDHFRSSAPLFAHLQTFADEQIERYRLQFKDAFLGLAEEAGLPLKIDFPRFFVLKGIEGTLDFSKRTTVINHVTLKSIDPRRIVSTALSIKRRLYDSIFEPQKFINALLSCYQEILKRTGQGPANSVPIYTLYADYVWSLQSQAFLQNMDKGKFKGYPTEQFAVDLWRFFESDVSAAEGGYRIKLNAGRGKSFWLIDQDGEKRQITHASLIKN